MNQSLWSRVDQYLIEQYLTPDPTLAAALDASAAASLPPINVSPTQGKLLHIYARMVQARRILEIGTLGGYSTIWLARALPADGRLVTLEYEQKHADVAAANFQQAGVADRIDLRVGRAIDLLPQLHQENALPFDFVFIDADKPSTADYFKWSLKLSHPGTVIIVDNVIRNGHVIDGENGDERVDGIRRFNTELKNQPSVTATSIQTVGSKGYDGFTIILVN